MVVGFLWLGVLALEFLLSGSPIPRFCLLLGFLDLGFLIGGFLIVGHLVRGFLVLEILRCGFLTFVFLIVGHPILGVLILEVLMVEVLILGLRVVGLILRFLSSISLSKPGSICLAIHRSFHRLIHRSTR